MEIGKKLKRARMNAKLTQEKVADEIFVSRQTISNWENEKSYPDIISVIRLSDLYQISLDDLLKGDDKMMAHLEDSTNVVNSNKKLILAFLMNLVTLILVFFLNGFILTNPYLILGTSILFLTMFAVLVYQLIKKI